MSEAGPPQTQRRYASLLQRLAAILIDAMIAWVVLAVVANVLVPGAIGQDPTGSESTRLGLITVIVLTAWFNYFVIGEWRWGRTLGKAAVGIRVVDDFRPTLTWNRAVMRNLLLPIDLVTGLFMIPLSERRQRLGDRLAHTVVLAKPAREAAGAAGSPPAQEPTVGSPASQPPAAPPPTSQPPPAGPPASQPPPSSRTAAVTDPGRTWGPGRVAVGILALLLTTVVEVAVVSAFDHDLSSLGARLAAQALLAVTLVGVAFAVTADRGGIAPPRMLGLRRPLRSPFGLAAAAYLGYVVMALLYSLFVHPHQKDITRDLGFGHGSVGTIAAGVLIVVAAPISEEIFFRGFVFGGLRNRLSFPAAALISAGIFGLFHYTGSGSLGVIPQLALLGFALAWVYEETGSIYPTMAIHALNNALAFAILTS
ncbi:MAG TPA: CPBP family glutamic-type intramembrane protease [Solirubrobacterales bacterium]|nr:CPBP family glutamic-type intramembrane protease [Solirubrobacterales bacterium]